MDADLLLDQIRDACKRLKMAQTTFGRLAVNDGKLVARLEQGGRVTAETVERVHAFIEQRSGESANSLRDALGVHRRPSGMQAFRFYENRHKYLMFVNTSSEKRIIADLAVDQLALTRPKPPAIRIFDGGSGDGTALTRLLRSMHSRYRWLPFYVAAKELSMENVRLTLEKLHDRFQEHPSMMFVISNLKYADAPWLQFSTSGTEAPIWHEVELTGNSAGEFEEQITALTPFLDQNWQASINPSTGAPEAQKPVVLIIYRQDHRFLLEPMLPRRGAVRADFDLVLLSQPYRADAPLKFKVGRIVAPLTRALAPGGRLVGVQSYGDNPGLEIIQRIWPDEMPFVNDRHDILRALRKELGGAARDYNFHAFSDSRAIFRYDFHTLPSETSRDDAELRISTLLGAWNAATYVAQTDDERLATAMADERYLEATRDVLRKYRGLWFNDEYFVVSRRDQFT